MNFHNWLPAVGRFLRDEDGPTAVEYAVMMALIIVACLGSVTLLAQKTDESFSASGDAIDGAFGP
ncbi:Flp family type IVb pilin [Roseimaritima ulvae]|uniref:Flp/Fap pilin component n=1 Tax=Roseimaritima ulvae TaxID=980254 RepID=A0A5B9QY86_9BACT|nr:Flp family type IVb pilin [Roseimaritima ulvae]QEG42859.1 Flp/Fap pilin component [Roseimaritima ulvae]